MLKELEQSGTSTGTDVSALSSKGFVTSSTRSKGGALNSKGGSGTGSGSKQQGRPWCDHCRQPGHTQDNCWKIHDKPV